MGRKGIGKLAGFGIAEIIEIRSIKNHRVTGFCLDYNKIKDLKHVEDYVIEVLEDQAYDEEYAGMPAAAYKNTVRYLPVFSLLSAAL